MLLQGSKRCYAGFALVNKLDEFCLRALFSLFQFPQERAQIELRLVIFIDLPPL